MAVRLLCAVRARSGWPVCMKAALRAAFCVVVGILHAHCVFVSRERE